MTHPEASEVPYTKYSDRTYCKDYRRVKPEEPFLLECKYCREEWEKKNEGKPRNERGTFRKKYNRRGLSLHIAHVHKNIKRPCRFCGCELTDENWSPHNQQNRRYICRKCLNFQQRNVPSRRPEYRYHRERKYRNRIRKEIIEMLGGKCVHCGMTDERCLQVDHINGNGHEERKIAKKKGFSSNLWIYQQLKKGHKDNYQLLCANCNYIKKFENRECSGPKNTFYGIPLDKI